MAAFENLGGFISTFADSSTTGLYLNDDGTMDIRASISCDCPCDV